MVPDRVGRIWWPLGVFVDTPTPDPGAVRYPPAADRLRAAAPALGKADHDEASTVDSPTRRRRSGGGKTTSRGSGGEECVSLALLSRGPGTVWSAGTGMRPG